MTIDEMIAVLQAAKEGKPIEVMVNPKVPQHGWQAADLRSALYVMSHGDPVRVKPEPREVWIPLECIAGLASPPPDKSNPYGWIRFREVIE